MTNSKLTLFLCILTLSLSAATTTYDIADLKKRIAQEKNRETIDRNALEKKYNNEIDQLFDYESLIIEQRNMLFEMKRDCFQVLVALVAQKDFGTMTAEKLDIIKLTAECFAKWGEVVAVVKTQDYLQEAYAALSPDFVKDARADGYRHALKVALSKKKKGLRYIIDGVLEQAVQKAIDDEMNGVDQRAW